MGDSKIGNIPTTVNDKIGNYINSLTTVEIENFRTNHFDDSSDDYVNFPVMKKTNAPNVRDKELNYYDVNICFALNVDYIFHGQKLA